MTAHNLSRKEHRVKPFPYRLSVFLISIIAHGLFVGSVLAQPAEAPRRNSRGPSVTSPEIGSDGSVTFRILAPKAQKVRLSAGDIPGDPRQPRELTKNDDGVWSIKVDSLQPGAYRYLFDVDGMPAADVRTQHVSESNGTIWSVVHVPGSDFMDVKDVPHGAVAQVHYRSATLGRDRRMHIYTPPGYESGTEKYPVLYLLHGASDSDDSWTSVGLANFIMDNLIASAQAKPMIIVMPAGHTGPFSFNAPPPPAADGKPSIGANQFEDDFNKEIRPYVEKHYRVLTDRGGRAIAGLSMGGAQTMNIAVPNLQDFGYVGVFSSGIFLRNAADWEKENKAILSNDEAKKGLKLLWFATGSEDFLMPRTRETVDLFKRNGFEPVFVESTGGHTWLNWRNYLKEFGSKLFQ